ncbi:MAG: D-2-hydroxyacid dehydrogenase [Oscillospiraceae bacterium]|nr:D-2-hydroxyacid dehydrogenase [Oscillospiraceae bacterium]
MKIVSLDGQGLNPGDLSWDCFRQFGEITVYPRTESAADTVERLQGADIVLLNKVPITAEILDACPDVKLICVLATGYNVVDCAAARDRGIPVCNVPDYSTAAVSQFTFALLLELCHRVGHHDHAVHQGKWSACPNFCFWDTPQMELAGKTMGIIGFGRIGRAVGRIASAMGMEVLAYNRSRCAEGEAIGAYVDLDTLLARSDVVSLHLPLTAENAGMVNEGFLAKMKDGAILLNTARGGLIDEAALAHALASGKLRGAAADVAAAEPIPADSPLLTAPNMILTPHMAWAPLEARQRILDVTVESIRGWINRQPVNTVN